jgi:4-hydroxybenzoate polyprenyltransferase
MNKYLRLARLNNIAGVILLALPGIWSLTLANKGLPEFKNFIIFLIGALFARSAGCVINDICDKKIDIKVQRTKNRPLAAGEVTTKNAILFVLLLLVIPFILILQTNNLSIYIAVSSIIPIILYPLMKRVTFWPQLFLGITFGLGAILGWSVTKNKIELPAISMYIGCIFWIMGFDTIYAFQDLEDDKKIGMKSTAIKFESCPKIFINICYVVFTIFFLLSVYLEIKQYAKLILFILPFAYIYFKLYQLDLSNKLDCYKKFQDNIWFGLGLFCILLIIF